MSALVQLGLTAFADMSLDEYKTHALGYRYCKALPPVGIPLSAGWEPVPQEHFCFSVLRY